jgi:hypothetical protein
MRGSRNLLFILVLACGQVDQNRSAEPFSHDSVFEIQSALDDWGGGRWQSVSVTTEAADTRLVVAIEVFPQGNDIAHDSYCRIVRDVIAPRLRFGQTWAASLTVWGNDVRTCS